MGPKKPDPRHAPEVESTDPNLVTIADPNNSRLTTMEQIMLLLQQQMQQQMQLQAQQQSTLERLEKRLSEGDGERRKLETGKSKVTPETEEPISELILVGSVPLSSGISMIGTSSTPLKPADTGERGRLPQRSQNTFSEEYRRDRESMLTRKMKIPLFDGEDADSWILRVDQYFEIDDFTEEEKLRAVRICFEGEALAWYRWERDRNPFRNWSQMKDRVLEQFSTTQGTTAGERLMALCQEGSVRDYIRDFKALATHAPEFPEPTLELAFMNGLKPKIRAGVKMLEPRTLEKMMSAAKKIEDWENPGEVTSVTKSESKVPTPYYGKVSSGHNGPSTQRSGNGPTNQNYKPSNKTANTGQAEKGRGPPNRPTTTHYRLKPPFRRLTPAEMVKWKCLHSAEVSPFS